MRNKIMDYIYNTLSKNTDNEEILFESIYNDLIKSKVSDILETISDSEIIWREALKNEM